MKRIAIFSVLASFTCAIAFGVIGSSVAPDGRLVEPFFLIPFAWLFLLNGIVFASISLLLRLRKSSAL